MMLMTFRTSTMSGQDDDEEHDDADDFSCWSAHAPLGRASV